MSVAVAERFIKRLETGIADGLRRLEDGKKRGHLSMSDMDELNRLEWSEFPICLKAIELSAEHAGKLIRDNHWHLVPRVLEQKGLFIRNGGDRPEVFIYGGIGEGYGGISADEFRNQLSKIPATTAINLHVHSGGGSYVDGVAIHSLIANRKGAVYGYVDGKAASAASLLLMPCASITMAAGSEMMIHNASIEPTGSYTEEDLERVLKIVSDTNDKLIAIYSSRWKGTQQELRAALKYETYFTPAEAVERGLADYISSGTTRIAAFEAVSQSHRAPNFSIAASDGPHKRFTNRRATMKLWQLAADDMRRDIGT